MEFIPMEDDLLSLEMEDVARDIFLVGSYRARLEHMLMRVSEWGRHSDILFLSSSYDFPTSIRPLPTDTRQRRRSSRWSEADQACIC